MSALDDMTGLMGPIIMGGVLMNMSSRLFPGPQQPTQRQDYYEEPAPRRSKRSRRQTRQYSNSYPSFGNFSNVLPGG